jgi:hypothetical protein
MTPAIAGCLQPNSARHFEQTLREHEMKAETWLARCAAELQHLYLTNPHCGEPDAASDE